MQPKRVREWLEKRPKEHLSDDLPEPQAVMVSAKPEREYPSVLPPKDHWFWRLMNWMAIQITYPSYRRWATWWLHRIPKLSRNFIWSVSRGRVTKDVHAARMFKCNNCSHAIKRLVVKKGKVSHHLYCSPCQCPEWWGSRLDRKNWWRGWECPQHKHDGPYRDDLWRDLITRAPQQSNGGCGGGG